MKHTKHSYLRAKQRLGVPLTTELQDALMERINKGLYRSKITTDKRGVYKYHVYTDGNLILPGFPPEVLVVIDTKTNTIITVA